MRIPNSLNRWKGKVEISLSDFLAMAVDIVESFNGIDRNEIRCDSYMGAVNSVEGMQPEVAVSG
jgi:hypothetical protein